MARKKVKAVTDQRSFTIVYNDFLDSPLLDAYEKIVFIAIKKFADNTTLKAFPSLNRLHKMTKISKSKIQDVIASLESKGVLRIDHRINDSGYQSNLYTLYDYAEVWQADNINDVAAVVDRREEERMVDLLKAKGYTIIKQELGTDIQPTKVLSEPSTQFNQYDIVNTTSNSNGSQAQRYSIEQIKQLYEYGTLINDYPHSQSGIDAVMDILHDTLNTTKPSIRISGEDKPSMVVIGKLNKLTPEHIMYALRKYEEQTDRISNPKAYLLTILYNAPEQMYFDLTNQVNHDMNNH